MALKRNPYPILESVNEDFLHHTFNAEHSAEVREGVFYFNSFAIFEEPFLKELVTEGKVGFAIKIEANPYFSRTFSATQENPDAIAFNFGYEESPANFSFNLTSMLIAKKDFIYKNKNAIIPLNKNAFEISINQILARAKSSITFEIGYRVQSGDPIIKLQKMQSGESPKFGAFDIVLDTKNIIVKVEEKQYLELNKLNEFNPKALDMVITLPVLQYVFSDYLINIEQYDPERYDWFDDLDENYNIRKDIHNMDDVLLKCNEIMNNPVYGFTVDLVKHYLVN